MARLLFQHNDPWFDELRVVSSYSEKDLERMILEHVDTVFPNYITIGFGKTLSVPTIPTGRRPDLAIVSKDYSEWWIVEVETFEDNYKHIRAQIEVFTLFDYNSFDIAQYIHSKDTQNFELHKLVEMVRDVKPKILILIDEVDVDFQKELENMGAVVCLFQVYKNKDGSHAFRLHGEYPKLFERSSHCKFVKSMAHTIEIFEPSWFISEVKKNEREVTKRYLNYHRRNRNRGTIPKKEPTNEVDIDFNGKVNRCTVILDGERAFLKLIGFNSMPVTATYNLYADHNFKLYIRLN
ncbi:MAG: hypothetical protein QM743_14380 [Chitinophagaceae bacterium]